MKNFDDLEHQKADDALISALREVDDDESLRAIVELDDGEHGDEAPARPIESRDYPDRTSYRQALIDQRQALLQERLGPTIAAIKKLGIQPLGSRGPSKTMVVEGPASGIAQMLSVVRVKAISLDRRLKLRWGKPAGR